MGLGGRERVWPRRVIEPRGRWRIICSASRAFATGARSADVDPVLSGGVGSRGALGCPRRGGSRRAQLAASASPHLPDLQVIQLPEVLSTYHLGRNPSPGRPPIGPTTTSTGDCATWPVSRPGCVVTTCAPARSARRWLRGRPPESGGRWPPLRHGRPGLPALGFAALSAVRVMIRR